MSVTGVPLTDVQIEAAGRLYGGLGQLHISDAALFLLSDGVPGFAAEACLLKTVAINTLYGTNLYAVVRMARHIHVILGRQGASRRGCQLVEEVAALPAEPGERKRSFISFASKFCHFFVNAAVYPIYDEAARLALRLHLGGWEAVDGAGRYRVFCEGIDWMTEREGLRSDGRALDRYLWITGLYMKWLRRRGDRQPEVNVELRKLFERPTIQQAADLHAMLPPSLDRPFRSAASGTGLN